MPTNFLHYCRLVFWAAWRHSRSWTQGIIFFAFVIAGVATLLVPNFGMTIDMTDLVNILKTPAIYAILFGSIILVRLICAPYWVWREERAARTMAEGEFSDDIRKNIDLKISALSAPAKTALYCLADGSIGLHQLNNEVEKELGDASLLTPKYAYDPAKFNEHWLLIKQRLRQNQQ
jgi:hypothetical protein